jgi:hypothetical protein
MFAYRQGTRFLATAAAGAAILAGLTACHPHVTGADAEGARSIAGNDLPAARPILTTIPDLSRGLKDLNEATDGPVRDAVIATACDAFAKGGNDRASESSVLSNLLEDTQPPEKQLLDAVQNLVATLGQDRKSGVTTLQGIGQACEAYGVTTIVG